MDIKQSIQERPSNQLAQALINIAYRNILEAKTDLAKQRLIRAVIVLTKEDARRVEEP